MSVSLSIIREQTDEKDDLQCITHNEASKIASLHAIDELGSVTFDHITNAAWSDPHYQDVINAVKTGFPEKRNQVIPVHLREFWEVRHRLSIFNSIGLLDKHIVVSHSLRNIVLDNLHAANQGVTGMRFHANQCVLLAWIEYWYLQSQRNL